MQVRYKENCIPGTKCTERQYMELIRARALTTRDEQNSLLVESHERLVQELTDEYEYKLQVQTRA